MNKKFLETIKVQDGISFHLLFHQWRMEQTLGGNFWNLSEMITPPKKGLYRCRILYDRGDFEVTYSPYVKRRVERIKLIENNSIEYGKKYANRMVLDTLFREREGADDILIVKNALVRDTTIANVAFYYKNQWLTPKKPLLYGTTRLRLLLEGKILEEEIGVEDLKKFSQMALMNAMIDFDIIQKKQIEEIIC